MSILRGPGPEEFPFLNEINQTARNFLLEFLQKQNDKVCLIDSITGQELRRSQIAVEAINLAAELQNLGCGSGTVIGILSENRLEYLTAVVGIMLSGAPLTSFNPAYTSDELRHTLSISRPHIVFCSIENYNKLQEAVKLEPVTPRIILFDIESRIWDKTLLYFSHLTRSGKNKLKPDTSSFEDTALIFHSSGTTGLPKGVMMSHKSFVYMLKIRKQKVYDISGIALTFVPMCHIYGLSVILSSLITDEPLVTMPKFDEKLFLETIQKYKIEILFLVPTIVKLLMKSHLLPKYDTSSLRVVTCGGAVLEESLEKEFQSKMNVHIQQAYAMTEAILIALKRLTNRKSGSSGTVPPGTQLKVIDTKTGKILGAKQQGEICVKGPQITKGYLRNEKATRELIDREGWLHTGDVGFYDEDGDFYIVDRLKDLIKYNEHQVPPAAIEAILLQHEDVQEAAVIGMPVHMSGEIPKAFVVKRVGSTVTAQELVDYVTVRVSSHRRLRGGVTFVDALPKNASGKILKRELKLKYLYHIQSKY